MEEELKCCPFCDSDDVELKETVIYKDAEYLYQVICKNCKASGPEVPVKMMSIKLWNNVL